MFQLKLAFAKAENVLSASLPAKVRHGVLLSQCISEKYLTLGHLQYSHYFEILAFRFLENTKESELSVMSKGVILQQLLNDWISCLQTHKLLDFINPEWNLLADIDKESVKKAHLKMVEIRQNMSLYLTADILPNYPSILGDYA